MSFNLPPASVFAPLHEMKNKEKKSRYTMPTLQTRWPMRISRSTNGSLTSKRSKDGNVKHKKRKSVDLPKSKSTDSLIISTRIDSELDNSNDRLDVSTQSLYPSSVLDTSFRWIKKDDSPGLPDAHALESVQLPEEITPRTPTFDRSTKASNSICGHRISANMPLAGGSCPIAAHQRQTLAQECHVSPPPMHPGRNRPYHKVSDIDTLQNLSGEVSTGNVSPILSSSLQIKAIPAFCGNRRPVASLTIVSPLSIDKPQPQRAFVIPSLNKLIQVETDPLLAQPRKSGNSSTSSEFGRSVSAPNSPASSRSSIYSDSFPPKSAAAFTEGGSRSSRAYSLISPAAAGVFDDNADLKWNPTFKNKFNLKQLRNQPLPAEPAIKISPLSIRHTSKQESMDVVSHYGRLIQPTSQPQFLPLDPRPSDLDILDEAFRRSGLHHVLPERCAQSRSGRASKSSTVSNSPSLRKATLDLEKQLSVLSGPIQKSTSWLKIGQNRISSKFPADCPPKPSKLRSSWRRSGSYSNVSPTKPSSPKKSNVHASFTLSTKKSWNGKEKIKVSPTISESVEEDDKPLPLRIGANGNNVNNNMGPSNNNSDAVKPTEKVNRMVMFTKERAGSVERNLRLRLPRLRTQLSAKSIPGPVDLSAVVVSPTDRAHNTNNDDSPKERKQIMAALNRLDPGQPEPQQNYYSYNNNDNDSAARILPLVFELDGSQSPPINEHPRSKDMLSQAIPSEVAKSIFYQIMQKIDNLEDLFNLAVINKAFYYVFREHSLTLIKDTLFRMSPAAWELREICPPWETEGDEAGDIDMPVPEYTPNLYIQHYTRDLYTMVVLKSLILVRCESFLRPDTARALAGLDDARCAEVDEAFWRVCTFCKLFGCGKGREDDITAQADWLNGGRLAEAESRGTGIVTQYPVGVHSVLFNAPPAFSKGNHGGLSSTELYDMMEIWTCLGVLLQVFHGKCKEARDFGVFDGLEGRSGDVAKEESLTESWTQYLLTLGPSAILALTSINPNAPIRTLFSRAQANGWTKWKTPDLTHGGPPRLFLKEAVSQVYESRLANIQTPTPSRTPKSHSPPPHSLSPIAGRRCRSRDFSSSFSYSREMSSQPTNPNRRRQAGFAAELRRKRKESQGSNMSVNIDVVPTATDFIEERPISYFSTVIENLDRGNGQGHSDAPPVPILPTAIPPPTHTTVRTTQAINSSLQNAALTSDAPLTRKPHPAPVPISAPPRPTVTLKSPTPLSSVAIISASSSPSLLQPASAPKQHQRTFSTPETAAEEKIFRGRSPAHTSQVLDPVDMAMHKIVTELGFSEAAAKWALKCTDTGESLDVAAAINLLLSSGHVGLFTTSATMMSATGNMNSSFAVSGGSGDRSESVSVNGMCRSKAMATSNEEAEDVWRPVWRWA